MADNFQYVQAQKILLFGSGVGTADVTIKLQSLATPDGVALTMADFGLIGFGTVEPGTVREEIISWTGITDNGDGTHTLTGVSRGLDFRAPYAANASRGKTHAGGSTFIITNAAPFYDMFVGKTNDETIEGLHEFEQNPLLPTADPTAANEASTKGYVDKTATGTATYDQQIISQVAGETFAAGDAVYFNSSDQEWYKTDATNSAKSVGVIVGIAQAAGTDGNNFTVLLSGLDKTQTGLLAGDTYYLSNVAGELSLTPGVNEVKVGSSSTATELIVVPINELTQDLIDALTGSEGDPSDTNKFITEDDVDSDLATKGLIIREGTVVDEKHSFVPSEDIDGSTTPQAVSVTEEAVSTQDTGQGSSAITIRSDVQDLGQTFITGASTRFLKNISVRQSNTSATGVRKVDIYLADANHHPTGPLLGTKSESFSGGVLVYKTFNFDTPVPLLPSTEYFAHLSSVSPGGSLWQLYRADPGLAGWFISISPNPGTSWNTATETYDISFRTTEIEILEGEIAKSDSSADDFFANAHVGFITTAEIAGVAADVTMGKIVSGFTGLTVGATYFLQDAAGTIGTVTGSQSRKIGLAISATELFIIRDNA